MGAYGPSGGNGGGFYTDGQSNLHIKFIRIWSGRYIDGIQLSYDLGGGLTQDDIHHGGSGGGLTTVQLQPGEFITQIAGKLDNFVTSLTIITTLQTTQTFGLGEGNQSYLYLAEPGYEIFGFFGNNGRFIDSIGVYTRQHH